MAHQVEAELSSSTQIKGGAVSPVRETGYQKTSKCQGKVLFSLLEALLRDQDILLSHTCKEPR